MPFDDPELHIGDQQGGPDEEQREEVLDGVLVDGDAVLAHDLQPLLVLLLDFFGELLGDPGLVPDGVNVVLVLVMTAVVLGVDAGQELEDECVEGAGLVGDTEAVHSELLGGDADVERVLLG